MIRTVMTENSVWYFNLDAKTYQRLPRGGVVAHGAAIDYTGEWEPYEELLDQDYGCAGKRLLVVRPVPMGTGRLRQSGVIESDVTEEA